MTLRVCDTAHDSIVDGPGLRLTVFLQGCTLNCPECHNPRTHALDGGELASVDELVHQIKSNPLLKGLTLSGGEPFLQAANAAALAVRAREMGLDVWCFSGKVWEELTQDGAPPEWRALLEQLDVLVDGPYISSKRTYDLPWRGSANQRVIDVRASLASGEIEEYQ